MPAGRAGLLETLLGASPDAVLLVDSRGIIDLASPAAQSLFGYRPEELIGRPVEILIPEEVRGAHVGHRSRFSDHPSARSMGAGLALFARRRDGTTLPVDVSLAPVDVEGSVYVVAFVRDATERRRSEALLRYVNEISQELLSGRTTSETLTLTAGRARALVGGCTAWVMTPAPDGQLVVGAADGEGAEELVGATLSAATSLSGRAMTEGSPVVVEDLATDVLVLVEARRLGLGPGLYLPLSAQAGPMGALVLARRHGEGAFDISDLSAAQVFASAAGVVLALGQARSQLEQTQMMTEHERIARDLHDTVIQRLFAIGMGLQGVQHLAEGTVASRIDRAVDTLDVVIREIRETIFDLNRPASQAPDLRQRIRSVVSDAVDQLGFQPQVNFAGPVETAVDEFVAPDLLAVLREALSNAARHSKASSVEVTVGADANEIWLQVVDDGVGLPQAPEGGGNGLVNMAERAHRLGGRLEVGARTVPGTALDWRVPIHG